LNKVAGGDIAMSERTERGDGREGMAEVTP
jgi:hypothetical protein